MNEREHINTAINHYGGGGQVMCAHREAEQAKRPEGRAPTLEGPWLGYRLPHPSLFDIHGFERIK